MKPCLGVGCTKYAVFDYNKPSPRMECTCGYLFCAECEKAWHEPVSCELLAHWLKRCSTDQQNLKWIRAFTKDCPRCKVGCVFRVQKIPHFLSDAHREEPGMQPHDLRAVQIRVLLDLVSFRLLLWCKILFPFQHGRLETTWRPGVQLLILPGGQEQKGGGRGKGRPGPIPALRGAL